MKARAWRACRASGSVVVAFRAARTASFRAADVEAQFDRADARGQRVQAVPGRGGADLHGLRGCDHLVPGLRAVREDVGDRPLDGRMVHKVHVVDLVVGDRDDLRIAEQPGRPGRDHAVARTHRVVDRVAMRIGRVAGRDARPRVADHRAVLRLVVVRLDAADVPELARRGSVERLRHLGRGCVAGGQQRPVEAVARQIADEVVVGRRGFGLAGGRVVRVGALAGDVGVHAGIAGQRIALRIGGEGFGVRVVGRPVEEQEFVARRQGRADLGHGRRAVEALRAG